MVEAESAPHAEVRDATLCAVLRDAYSLLVLLHGPLRALLEGDPSGASARRVLEPLVSELGSRLAAGKLGDLAAHANALSSREGLPILPLDRAAFLNVQFAVNALETCCGGQLVQQALLFHDNSLCWSGLPVEDTHSLYRYAARCLLPAALASPAAVKRARGGSLAVEGPPFRAGEWRLGSDAFLEFLTAPPAAEPAEAAAGGSVRIHLSGDRRFSLCALARDSLTLLLLLPETSQLDRPLRAQLAAIAGACASPRLACACSLTPVRLPIPPPLQASCASPAWASSSPWLPAL